MITFRIQFFFFLQWKIKKKKKWLWKLILGEDISIIAWFAIIDNQPKSHLLHSNLIHILFAIATDDKKRDYVFDHEDTYIQAQCLRSNVAKKKHQRFSSESVHLLRFKNRELFEKRERVLFLLACGTEEEEKKPT